MVSLHRPNLLTKFQNVPEQKFPTCHLGFGKMAGKEKKYSNQLAKPIWNILGHSQT